MLKGHCESAVIKNIFLPQDTPKVNRLTEHLSFREADSEFCIAYLGTLHFLGVKCEIFDKAYVYKKGMYDEGAVDSEESSIEDFDIEFFQGLPELTGKQAKKGATGPKIPK